MAKRILAQTFPFGKVENDTYAFSLANKYKEHKNPTYQECSYALRMSNDDAVELLRKAGFAQIIPGTHFAPAKDYAKFLDVPELSLYSYIDRYKLNHTCNPAEAISVELKTFFRRVGLLEHGELSLVKSGCRGIFDFHFTKTDTHYVTGWNYSTRLYSARIVLAVIPFMARHHKRYDADHPSVKLYESLSVILEKMREEERQLAERLEAEEAARNAAATGVQAVEAQPEVLQPTISEEFLYGLVKKAVAEVLSGAKVEMTAPFTITT